VVTVNFTNVILAEGEIVGLAGGRYVRVVMKDEGQGIAGEIIDKIFDPYFSTQEKKAEKGLGLGLAIVHSIVKKHDGKIFVESVPGEGTMFTIYFPALFEKGDDPDSGNAVLPTGKGFVLVLAEGGEDLGTVCEMVSYLGYKAVTVQNVEDASDFFRENQEKRGNTVFIIVDLGDSFRSKTVADRLSQEIAGARIFLALHDPDGSQVEKYRQKGGYEIISKPYNLLELNRAFSTV
jgi:hypothetical protein